MTTLYMCHTKAMTTLVEHGTRCLYEDTNFYSVLIVRSDILIKTEIFSFSKMFRRDVLSACQANTDSHRNIFNHSKTVCMTCKAKSAKSTVTPLLTHGW